MKSPADISAESLIDEAVARAGAPDAGGLCFVDTLEHLLESCRQTGRLNNNGWQVLRKAMVRHLRNQLYLRAYLDAAGDPPSTGAGAGTPIVITGLPRTGTTLLHNLLALDPDVRVLRFWEALHPVPPDPARGIDRETLIVQAERWLERLYGMAPAMKAIHSLTAEGPEECDALMQNSFASQHFDDMFAADDYSDWLYSTDLSEHYAYYALQLRTLAGAGDSATWLLKSPSHLAHLPALRSALPGAVIVQCHRHPEESIASWASLVMAVRTPNCDEVPARHAGQQCLSRALVAVERAMEYRDQCGGEGIVDVGYRRLLRDPVSVVEEIYLATDRPFPPEMAAAVQQWVTDHPQHEHGRHQYRLDDFEVTPTEVAWLFEAYLRRFQGQILY